MQLTPCLSWSVVAGCTNGPEHPIPASPRAFPIPLLGPSTPISAHLGAISPCPSYTMGACVSSPVSSPVYFRLDPWLDPRPGALCAMPCLGPSVGPAASSRFCPTCSAPVGWHPPGEGTAGDGVSLPQLLPWGSSQPLAAPQRVVFFSVLWKAKILLIAGRHRYV